MVITLFKAKRREQVQQADQLHLALHEGVPVSFDVCKQSIR